ncbi:MAG: hypothetical protein R3E83_06860 [Burkholderiaceae bacterium]
MPAEQGSAQRRTRERETARMKIRQVERVRQQEVAVEAHERAGIDAQRDQPAGRGQKKHCAAGRPIGQQAPGQGGETGERQFNSHPGCRDPEPVAAPYQLPRLTGIGVKHRPQHQKRHAHVRDPHPQTGRGDRMTQLMQGLGQNQGERPAEQTGGRHEVGECMDKAVPLAHYQAQAKRGRHQGQQQESPRIEHRAPRRQRLQPALRAHEWEAKEQIVMQQPAKPREAALLGGMRQTLHARGIMHRDQLLTGQELANSRHLIDTDLQWRLLIDPSCDQCRIA